MFPIMTVCGLLKLKFDDDGIRRKIRDDVDKKYYFISDMNKEDIASNYTVLESYEDLPALIQNFHDKYWGMTLFRCSARARSGHLPSWSIRSRTLGNA